MPRFKQDKVFEYKGWWIERIATSPFYYAARYDQSLGRVRRKSLGTVDLEDAKDALIRSVQLDGPKSADSFLATVLEAYYRNVSDSKPSASMARIAGMHLLAFWGATSRVSDVTEERQKAFWLWSRDKGHAPATTARVLTVLSAALRHSINGLAPRVTTCGKKVADYQGVPEPQPREWIPTDDQLARYLDSLCGDQAEHVFRYTLIALNTLARPSAILELEPNQIDFERGLVNLNPQGRPQNKKRRPVVRLTETLRPWLVTWGEVGSPYVRFRGGAVVSVKRTFKRHGQSLGFPEFSPYTLRHKMATELAARGVAGEVLKRQLGHKSPDLRMTERYIKYDPRLLAEAKSAIEDYLGSLNRLTERELLRPHSFKILPSPPFVTAGDNGEDLISPLSFSRLIVVGGTGIEPVAPSMSRKCSPAELTAHSRARCITPGFGRGKPGPAPLNK